MSLYLPTKPLNVSLRKHRGRKVVKGRTYTYEYYTGTIYIPKHVGEYLEQEKIEVKAIIVPAEVADKVFKEARKIVDFNEAVKDWANKYLRSRG